MTHDAARLLQHAVPDAINFRSWEWTDQLNPSALQLLCLVARPVTLHRREAHTHNLLVDAVVLSYLPCRDNGFMLSAKIEYAVSKSRSTDAWHQVWLWVGIGGVNGGGWPGNGVTWCHSLLMAPSCPLIALMASM